MKKQINFLLTVLTTTALFAQFYPKHDYKLSADGKTLIKWEGKQNAVIMQNDTVLEKVKHIGEDAFGSSQTLEIITLPNVLESIGERAFSSCLKLKEGLVLPSNVKIIGKAAFTNCKNITGELIIPNSVTSIGDEAFKECSGLDGSLTIGNSVTSIGWKPFEGCPFTTIRILAKKPPEVNDAGIGISTHRPLFVPTGCVETYKTHPYWGSFETITEYSTPTDSYELSPDGTTLLRWKGSERIIDTQDDPVLKKVKHIAENTFANPNGGTNSDKGKNYDENKTLRTIVLPEGLETIGDHAFVKCTALSENLNIPNTVTSIGVHAFRECAFRGTLTIPNSVENIAAGAFAYCSGFTALKLGNNLKKISNYTFYKCSGLTGDLEIGEKIETIGKEAFYQCTGLTGSLSIGKNVTAIGEKAFDGCPFTAINVFATTPPAVRENGPGLNTSTVLAVPKDSKEAYKRDPYWGEFTISNIPTSINKVEATAKELCFYPSPVKDILTVDCKKSIEGYALYSGTGVLLQSKKTKDKQLQIDMANYPSGIYFLRLLSQEKTKTITLIKK